MDFNPRQKITIPKSAQALSGIRIAPRLELHVLDGGIVVTKAEMSAMDMVNLIAAMSNLVTDLGAQLGAVCGQCDECGYCDCFCGDEIHIKKLKLCPFSEGKEICN